jgi:flagellar basal-body rod modification protein FlgD
MADLIPFDVKKAMESAPAAPEAHGSNKLGKDEFLKLLMAQLGHQDPTAPTDSEAFVAQLAQFASLELQQNTNASLDNLLVAQAASQQTAVLTMVGRDVTFRTDKISLADGVASTTSARIQEPAASTTAVIVDSSGRTVRTMQLGPQAAGTFDVTWDGRDDMGNPQPPGTYTVRVTASDAAGKSIEVQQRGAGRVTGISFEDGVPELLLGTEHVKLSDIVEIKERNTQ